MIGKPTVRFSDDFKGIELNSFKFASYEKRNLEIIPNWFNNLCFCKPMVSGPENQCKNCKPLISCYLPLS